LGKERGGEAQEGQNWLKEEKGVAFTDLVISEGKDITRESESLTDEAGSGQAVSEKAKKYQNTTNTEGEGDSKDFAASPEKKKREDSEMKVPIVLQVRRKGKQTNARSITWLRFLGEAEKAQPIVRNRKRKGGKKGRTGAAGKTHAEGEEVTRGGLRCYGKLTFLV